MTSTSAEQTEAIRQSMQDEKDAMARELAEARALLAEIYEWQAGTTILPVPLWRKLRAAVPLPTQPGEE